MVIKDIETLINNFYNYNYIKNRLPKSYIKKLTKFSIPMELRVDIFKNCKFAYSKCEVDEYIKKYKQFKPLNSLDLNSVDIISAGEAMNLLNLSTRRWRLLKKSYNLKEVKLNHYLRNDIMDIFNLQQLFIENHLNSTEVKKIIKKNIINNIKSYPIPDYAATSKFTNRETAYRYLDIMLCISKGHAKDSYYIENNISFSKNLERRKNLIVDNSINFENMNFDDFSNLYYTNEEVQDLLIRRFLNKAKFINVYMF